MKQFRKKALYLITYKTTTLFFSVQSCFFGLQNEIILRHKNADANKILYSMYQGIVTQFHL